MFFFVESLLWNKTRTFVQTKAYNELDILGHQAMELVNTFLCYQDRKDLTTEDRRECCSQLAQIPSLKSGI